jgi:hypothetical protein
MQLPPCQLQAHPAPTPKPVGSCRPHLPLGGRGERAARRLDKPRAAGDTGKPYALRDVFA